MNIYTVRNKKTGTILYCGERRCKAISIIREWKNFPIEIEEHFFSQVNFYDESILTPEEFDIEFSRISLLNILKNRKASI